tara:strand:- start:190 stop:852 length:663 start_codon:yes stop_codon:yes gene_type:complete
MKLMTEINEDLRYITEEDKETGKTNSIIEGVFMQSNIKNRNGRFYPKETMSKEVGRYMQENVSKNRAYGELGHPAGPTINLERVSHMITSLKEDGDNFVGRAKVMDTPYGNIVKNLMSEGAQLGISSRAMGTLKEKNGMMEVQKDFRIATAGDIVADPSAPEAYVRSVMEGADWVYDAGTGNWVTEEVNDRVKALGMKNAKHLEEQTLELFQKFLNSIRV